MTQIALNGRFYAHRPTGMQRYALEVSKRCAGFLDVLKPARGLRGPSGHLWEQLYLPSVVRGRMLWSPNNTGPLAVAHQVCTIHDLIPLEHPEWFNRRFGQWYEWLLPRLGKRVQHLIAVSEFTKQRVVELLRVPEQRVTVIPNGVSEEFFPRSAAESKGVRKRLGIDNPDHLLSVGSLEPRKNLHRLLAAWKKVQASTPRELELVVVGPRNPNPRVFGDVALSELPPRVHFTGYVPDECLPGLYSGALAFVYPSLYEGFGLPPLEAMACGTPVVTSRGSSLVEVVGDDGVLVDPWDENSIAEGILEILSNETFRNGLRERARVRAKKFTWEGAARQTLKVLLEQSRC